MKKNKIKNKRDWMDQERWDVGIVLAQAAFKKCHRLDGLNCRSDFLEVLEAGSVRSGCQRGWVLLRALFLA